MGLGFDFYTGQCSVCGYTPDESMVDTSCKKCGADCGDVFEIGKFYRHASGLEIHIVGDVNTTLYDKILVAENSEDVCLRPVSIGPGVRDGWVEISDKEWMSNFC